MLPPGIWSLRVAEGGRLVGVSRVLASNERQSSQGARIGLVVFSFPKIVSCLFLVGLLRAGRKPQPASIYLSDFYLFLAFRATFLTTASPWKVRVPLVAPVPVIQKPSCYGIGRFWVVACECHFRQPWIFVWHCLVELSSLEIRWSQFLQLAYPILVLCTAGGMMIHSFSLYISCAVTVVTLLRPRLDPKNFGFWLTVAFRLYLVISV